MTRPIRTVVARPRRLARLLVPLLLALPALGVGGCANDEAQRLAYFEQENVDLRNRATQLQSRLDEAEAELDDAEAELRAARQEAEVLRQERAAQPEPARTGFEGLAGVETSITGGGEVVVDIAGDVLFDSGRATLKGGAKRTLDQIAGVLRSQYSGRLVRIAGHTDTDPIRKSKWKTNERLSAERALAVEQYLAEQGVETERMYVAAYGSAYPRATKAESRRVEIIIMNERAG